LTFVGKPQLSGDTLNTSLVSVLDDDPSSFAEPKLLDIGIWRDSEQLVKGIE